MRRFAVPTGVVALASISLACSKPSISHPGCEAREIAPDASSASPRPDASKASFHFHGNNPEQREFVFLHRDGSYDYAERWDLGVPAEDELQTEIGWDWKVGCRMYQCPLPDGTVCCYQRCRDGGASGAGHEPPDQFDCMNKAAGGPYDWFLAGLRNNGMPALAACFE